MTGLTKRQQEIAAERRAEAGLPVLTCPNCGKPEAHWVPDMLDDYGLIVHGCLRLRGEPMSPRGVYERAPRPRKVPKDCDVDGCEKMARTPGADLCEMHYMRKRRGVSKRSEKLKTLIDRANVMREMYERGMSTTQIGAEMSLDASAISKWLRRVGTKMRPWGASGDESPRWLGGAVSYGGAHMRVRAQRGDASDRQCACGRQAFQWAYLHDDPDELASPMGPYSADPSHYVAMCVSCHKRFDLARLR